MKTFSDQLLNCESCGRPFVFQVSEQRSMYESRGEVTTPAKCPGCRLHGVEPGRRRGEVKWFDVQKGYGFIRTPEGQEIFFHRSSLVAADPWEIHPGQVVSFEEQRATKGPEAVRVELLD